MVQELFFEVQRKKSHFFLDAKENSTVFDLKCMIKDILKVSCQNVELFRLCENGQHTQLDSRKTLAECGFNPTNARAQQPATIGMMLKGDDSLEIEKLSTPPPIPDAMRNEQQAE
ncbi:unnamed protein product [Caenorhabditis auriculariae]|uniref:Ubiquitin-like domain-containing protein n=1 Tax=Caenorhabditis auriculariae TaxID=2777116 RepID=A0A8S1HUI0_9PELO|nr:unnamed protein product [Caenorhabditis auriculariae]